jgi:hypothetical protein
MSPRNISELWNYRASYHKIVLFEIYAVRTSDQPQRREFENGVLRRIFEPKKKYVTEAGETSIMRNFINCTLRQILT